MNDAGAVHGVVGMSASWMQGCRLRWCGHQGAGFWEMAILYTLYSTTM